MPLRAQPSRQPDGIGRQEIHPEASDRPRAGLRRAVGWLPLFARRLLVVFAAALVGDLVGWLLGAPHWVVGLSVAEVVVCAVALVVFLVASRSGGRS